MIAGRPGQQQPDPAPGTNGRAVTHIHLPDPAPAGTGLAAAGASGYGALIGRVAEFCADGDHHAALLRTAAEIAAAADLHDPAAITSITRLVAGVLHTTATRILDNDITIRAGHPAYAPRVGASGRLVAAADPRTPPPTAPDLQRATATGAAIAAATRSR